MLLCAHISAATSEGETEEIVENYAQAVDQRLTRAEKAALADLDPRVRKQIAENARTELEEIRKDPLKRLYTQVLEEQSDPGEAALDAQNNETAPQETRDAEDGTHDDIHTDATQAHYYEDAARSQKPSVTGAAKGDEKGLENTMKADILKQKEKLAFIGELSIEDVTAFYF